MYHLRHLFSFTPLLKQAFEVQLRTDPYDDLPINLIYAKNRNETGRVETLPEDLLKIEGHPETDLVTSNPSGAPNTILPLRTLFL